MNEFTLPGLSRKRRALDPDEALIPCVTTPTPQASHLTDDRRREPTFEDLLAGNDREPSHADLLVDDEPTEQPRPKRYPGVSVEALAWLREQDGPDARDEHAFDTDRLIPVGHLVAVPLPAPAATPPAPPAIEKLPPVGNPRLLFDALDALDRLPALHSTDDGGGGSYQLATNAAAVLTYGALRPDLLNRHEIAMQLAPLLAELAEVTL